MKNTIKHLGEIVAADGSCAKVKIVQASACASCKAAKLCNASESKEKMVDVYGVSGSFEVGQKVMVSASYGVGMFALFVAMIVPMILMLAVLFSCVASGIGETMSAIYCISSLIPYYLLVYLFRNRINKRVSFSIEAL